MSDDPRPDDDALPAGPATRTLGDLVQPPGDEPAAEALPPRKTNVDTRISKAETRRRVASTVLAVLGPLAGLAAAAERAPVEEAAEGRLIDLSQAINRALAQNRALLQSRLNVDAAAQVLAGERAEFSFQLVPQGTVSETSGLDAFEVGIGLFKRTVLGTRGGVSGAVARDAAPGGDPLERSSVRIEISQPLLRRFGTLVNLDPVTGAELNLRSTRRLLEQQRADLVLEVVTAYEDVLRLEGQVLAEQGFFGRLDRVYRLTRARERQGRARRVDTLRLELQRGESQSRLERAREDLAARREDLAVLLGTGADTRFALSTPPLLEVETGGPRESLRVARGHRMDYAQALEDYADASRGIAIARRGLLPDLSLVARYEWLDWRASPAAAPGDTFYSIGLAADTDLIAARTHRELEERVINRETLHQQVLILEDGLERTVNRALRAYRRAGRELEIADGNLAYAADRARLAQRMFEAGRGDSFTVSDAADGLQAAERRLLDARAEASVAAYRLLHTLGILVEFPGELRPRPEQTP
jgi:outer membrane protein TolC